MGTLTADTPMLDSYCEHKLPSSCRLTSIPECCACADERAHSASYSTYIDGIGFVLRGLRWQRYCWFCKEFWQKRVDVSGLQPAQTRVPEVPDQTAFLEKWYDFYRGYRTVRGEDGTEERIAVLGEPFRDVDPGELPRTLEELREGRERSRLDEMVDAPMVEEQEAGPGLEETLERMFEDAEEEDGPAERQQSRPRDSSVPQHSSPTNVAGQVMVAAGSRNRDYQARRVAALRRELHRMRNGIERVISGLREFGENVPSHAETTGRLTDLGRTLDNISGLPSQDDAAARAIENVHALTANSSATQADRTLANLQVRVDAARQHADEAQRNRDQAAAELDLAEQERRTSRHQLQQVQREQRTAENYMRLFGSREDMAAAGDAYESPIGGMFTRAEERYRTAEEVRREQVTLRQVLEDETRAGGEVEQARLTELEWQERDVWGVPGSTPQRGQVTRSTRNNPARGTASGIQQSALYETDTQDDDTDEATLEEYYAMLRRQDWTQRLAEREAGIPATASLTENFPRSMLSEPTSALLNSPRRRATRVAARAANDAAPLRITRTSSHDSGLDEVYNADKLAAWLSDSWRPPQEKSRSHWWRSTFDGDLTDLYVSEWDVPSGEGETLEEYHSLLRSDKYTQTDGFEQLANTPNLAITTVFPQYRLVAPNDIQVDPPTKRNFYAEAEALLGVLHTNESIETLVGLQQGEKERCLAQVEDADVDVVTKHEIETLYQEAELIWAARLPTMRLNRIQEGGQLLEIICHDSPPILPESGKLNWWEDNGWWEFQLKTEFMAQLWADSPSLQSNSNNNMFPEEGEQMMARMSSNQRDEDDVAVVSQLVCDSKAVAVANTFARQRRGETGISSPVEEREPFTNALHGNEKEQKQDMRNLLTVLAQDEVLRNPRDGFNKAFELSEIHELLRLIDESRDDGAIQEKEIMEACDHEILFRAGIPQARLARFKRSCGQQFVNTRDWGARGMGEDDLASLNTEIMANAYILSEELRGFCFVNEQSDNTALQKREEMLHRLHSGQRTSDDRAQLWGLVQKLAARELANEYLRRQARDEGLNTPRERTRQIDILSRPQQASEEPSDYYGLFTDVYHDALIMLDEFSRSVELRGRYGLSLAQIDQAFISLRIEAHGSRRTALALLEPLLANEELLWETGIPTVMMLKMRRMDKDMEIRSLSELARAPRTQDGSHASMWKRIMCMELLAQAYVISSQVRRACRIAMERQPLLLFRLCAGKRTKEDRLLLSECLEKSVVVEAANKVMEQRYGTREEIGRERERMFEEHHLIAPRTADNDEELEASDWYITAQAALSALHDSWELRARFGWDMGEVLTARFFMTPRSAASHDDIKSRIHRLLTDNNFVWAARVPEGVVARLRARPGFDLHLEGLDPDRSTSPDDNLADDERPKYGIPWDMVQLELLAQFFRRPGELGQVPLGSQESPPYVRSPSRLAFLANILESPDMVESANVVIRSHMAAGEGNEGVESGRHSALTARQEDSSIQGLEEQRRATSALLRAAGRAAVQPSTRGLFERLANRDDASRDAFRQLEANGFSTVIPDDSDISDNGTMSESEEEESEEDEEDEENEEEDLGLDAPDTGRPEPKTDEELTVKLECRICYSQTASMACLPCGHLVMCQWCSDHHSPCMPHDKTRPLDRFASCPVCRKTIRQKVKVFTATA